MKANRIIFIGVIVVLFAVFGWFWFTYINYHTDGPGYNVIHAEAEMQGLFQALQSYETDYGKYPSENFSEILSALKGNNPKKICFINLGVRSTNAAGLLTDPWETPYQIEIKSGTNSHHLHIRSAGPNRTFGDNDDITFNSVSNDFVKP